MLRSARAAHYDMRSSAPARRGSPPRCTRPRTASRRSCSRRDVPGGQASHTSMIENFFGFPDGIGGAELARLAGRQAEGFGAELVVLAGSWAATRPGEHRLGSCPAGTR